MAPSSKRVSIIHYAVHLFLGAYFILFLTIGDTGFWLYARVYLCIIRNEISEMIEGNTYQDSIEIITIVNTKTTEHDLSWTEHGKEFSYRGEMYDVITATTSADSTNYVCIKDTKETKFRSSIDQHVKNERASSPALFHYNLKAVKDFQKPSVGDHTYYNICRYAKRNILQYDDPEIDLSTPPPKPC